MSGIFDANPRVAAKAVNAILNESGGVVRHIMAEPYRCVEVKYVKRGWWFRVSEPVHMAGWYTASPGTIAGMACPRPDDLI